MVSDNRGLLGRGGCEVPDVLFAAWARRAGDSQLEAGATTSRFLTSGSRRTECYNLTVVQRFPLGRQKFLPRPTHVGEWLSLVEHLVRDQGVGGSNPLSPTIFSLAGSNGYAAFRTAVFSVQLDTTEGNSKPKLHFSAHILRKTTSSFILSYRGRVRQARHRGTLRRAP
jgi:hypothetical protein